MKVINNFSYKTLPTSQTSKSRLKFIQQFKTLNVPKFNSKLNPREVLQINPGTPVQDFLNYEYFYRPRIEGETDYVTKTMVKLGFEFNPQIIRMRKPAGKPARKTDSFGNLIRPLSSILNDCAFIEKNRRVITGKHLGDEK